VEHQVVVRLDDRMVKYDFGELDEVAPAYAVTIHKSQGSEFPAVVIPLATQHYMLLQRNLIYTGITRGKKQVVLIGQKNALGITVHKDRPQRRYSGLLASLRSEGSQTITATAPPVEHVKEHHHAEAAKPINE
jgi:exodeoxyribonuclease V alpha subunit